MTNYTASALSRAGAVLHQDAFPDDCRSFVADGAALQAGFDVLNMHDVLLVGCDLVLPKELLMIKQLCARSTSILTFRPVSTLKQQFATCTLHDDTPSGGFALAAAIFIASLLRLRMVSP
jgi:hypothetical protein